MAQRVFGRRPSGSMIFYMPEILVQPRGVPRSPPWALILRMVGMRNWTWGGGNWTWNAEDYADEFNRTWTDRVEACNPQNAEHDDGADDDGVDDNERPDNKGRSEPSTGGKQREGTSVSSTRTKQRREKKHACRTRSRDKADAAKREDEIDGKNKSRDETKSDVLENTCTSSRCNEVDRARDRIEPNRADESERSI